MIFSRTILKVCDNSGAKYVKALSVWGDITRPYGKLCDPMLVVPKKLKRRQKRARADIQKRKKYIAIVLSTVWNTRRRDGTFIKFVKSAAILFSLKQKLLGTSVRMPLCKEFKISIPKEAYDYKKIISQNRLCI